MANNLDLLASVACSTMAPPSITTSTLSSESSSVSLVRPPSAASLISDDGTSVNPKVIRGSGPHESFHGGIDFTSRHAENKNGTEIVRQAKLPMWWYIKNEARFSKVKNNDIVSQEASTDTGLVEVVCPHPLKGKSSYWRFLKEIESMTTKASSLKKEKSIKSSPTNHGLLSNDRHSPRLLRLWNDDDDDKSYGEDDAFDGTVSSFVSVDEPISLWQNLDDDDAASTSSSDHDGWDVTRLWAGPETQDTSFSSITSENNDSNTCIANASQKGQHGGDTMTHKKQLEASTFVNHPNNTFLKKWLDSLNPNALPLAKKNLVLGARN